MGERSATGSVTAQWHRALFLSDLHLGAQGCAADRILSFLERNDADVFYLVGDIFDIWDPLFVRWSPLHDRILDLLRQRAARGSRLVYLTGNHDRALRRHGIAALQGRYHLPVEIAAETVHHGPDGRRYLVLHGDICDARLLRLHICTRIGSRLDGMLRLIDLALRHLRFRIGPDQRGPIEVAISWINSAMAFGHGHERRLVALARAGGHDGVICGHFHLADLHDDHGLIYANCGDWVDSMTAVAEGQDGVLRLIGLPEAATAQDAATLPADWTGADA